MREAEYGDMGVVVPRADRPEIVARMRRTGLTQQAIAETLGVSVDTVARSEPDDLRGQRGPAKTPQMQGIDPPSVDIVDGDDMVCEVHHPEDSACAWDCLGKPYVRDTPTPAPPPVEVDLTEYIQASPDVALAGWRRRP